MRFFKWLVNLFGSPTPTAGPVPKPVPPKPQPAPPEQWDKRLLELHNAARELRGAVPLIPNERLKTAAQLYAEWCAANGVLPGDHHGPNNNTVGDRLREQGYSFSRAGENIARGQQTADDAFTAWMNSAGHYQNIVHPNHYHFGAGRAVDKQGRVYWVCDFAAQLGNLSMAPQILIWSPPGLDPDTPKFE